MAELFVGVRKLVNVRKHPDADLLDLANIDHPEGFQVVIPRDYYRSGDLVVYIPEGCIVPEWITDEIGVTGKLAGPDKNRVKIVRLRGVTSQGLVWFPADNSYQGAWYHRNHKNKTNLAEQLGITKWVPEVPVHMAGDVEPAPKLLKWVEVENLKIHNEVFQPGEEVVVQEKIHGTCCLITYDVNNDRLLVSSKGMGSMHLALKESDTNLYWQAVKYHNVHEKLRDLAEGYSDVSYIALFAEVYGVGVQDLHYGANARKGEPGLAVFDLVLVNPATSIWYSHPWFDLRDADLPYVPVLYEGPYDREIINGLVDGPEQVSGRELHIREGVVVKPVRQRYVPELGGPAILKLVSEAYLTRKGGTEYQ